MRIGVIGARSMVGRRLLTLLLQEGYNVLAFSRSAGDCSSPRAGLRWACLTDPLPPDCVISHWIIVAPIWVLPDYFSLLAGAGARRVVALSSTSSFSKQDSSLSAERALAARLVDGERQLVRWSERSGIGWTLLRPTLIYGYGEDENVTRIAQLVRRFGVFPLLGSARGLRQPVHVEDVAQGCFRALLSPVAANQAYALSGGETLSYRHMVARISVAVGVKPRFIRLPLVLLRTVLPLLRLVPRYRHVNSAMVLRMNRNLVYDHSAAARDIAFSPRGFHPTGDDVTPASRL